MAGRSTGYRSSPGYLASLRNLTVDEHAVTRGLSRLVASELRPAQQSRPGRHEIVTQKR